MSSTFALSFCHKLFPPLNYVLAQFLLVPDVNHYLSDNAMSVLGDCCKNLNSLNGSNMKNIMPTLKLMTSE